MTRDYDCPICGCGICVCPRWRGTLVRVLVVVLGLWVIGCVAGATAGPWCD